MNKTIILDDYLGIKKTDKLAIEMFCKNARTWQDLCVLLDYNNPILCMDINGVYRVYIRFNSSVGIVAFVGDNGKVTDIDLLRAEDLENEIETEKDEIERHRYSRMINFSTYVFEMD